MRKINQLNILNPRTSKGLNRKAEMDAVVIERVHEGGKKLRTVSLKADEPSYWEALQRIEARYMGNTDCATRTPESVGGAVGTLVEVNSERRADYRRKN